ncbi:TonB-dependent receptor [Niveibacterium sp. SC-1]|uniref:TonB-dependent receptor n=1 Tax=Niveibacterium sp. SC-1 TaxID=3135646 RepID=UPI00311DB79C
MRSKQHPFFALRGLCFGAAVLASDVGAAEPERTDERELPTVQVTGSSIPRIEAEGPVPVEVITETEIRRTGAATINELLRSLPVVDFNDAGELSPDSPSGSGTARIRMRGLTENDVLVLLNGRRLPRNALADASGAADAVDVNMIPLAAIERVEIFKGGASAIYGADALAGVVNFITRSDYQGVAARTGGGISAAGDGAEYQLGLTAGIGDLARDRYNLTVILDGYKRDPIYRRDRSSSASADFRARGGGDERSVFAPEGNLLDADFAFTGQTVRPCPAERTSDGLCRYDFNADILTAYNGARRGSLTLLGEARLAPQLQASGELVYSQTRNHFENHPTPDIFAAADGSVYAGRFMQGGPRITERESELVQLGGGLQGGWGDLAQALRWDVHYSYGRSTVSNRESNVFDSETFYPAVLDGSLDPTRADNDPALVDSLRISPERRARYSLNSIDAKLTGLLGEWGERRVDFAVGAQYLGERLSDQPDPLSQAGRVVGSVQQAAVDAGRDAFALFAELDAQLAPSLEAQLAARYDRYPDESRTSPKLALLYRPLDALALRGSYARSFRAPGLKQLYGGQEQGAITIEDPAWCAAQGVTACEVPAYQVVGANADLKAETGSTLSLGATWQVWRDLSIGLDWWQLRKKDAIGTKSLEQALADGDWQQDGGFYYVDQRNRNVAATRVEGIDLDLRFAWRLPGAWSLSLRDALTRYLQLEEQLTADSPWGDRLGTYATPRWRNVLGATLGREAWAITAALRTTGGFSDSDAYLPHLADTPQVGAFEELDLNLDYHPRDGFSFSAGVRNLLDRTPPFSNQNASGASYTQMGFAEIYSNRGRFFYLRAEYAFQ